MNTLLENVEIVRALVYGALAISGSVIFGSVVVAKSLSTGRAVPGATDLAGQAPAQPLSSATGAPGDRFVH